MSTQLVRQGDPYDPVTGEVFELGRLLDASGFFGDVKEATQAAVKVMAGREIGFPAIASMMGVYIVKGKVTLSAHLMAAAIKRHPAYTYRIVEHTADVCRIAFLEHGEVIGESSFTIADAEQAGLMSNDPWQKHPRNMLFARALSNGAKWHCPDVFGGPVYTPEELGAAIDGETGEMVGRPAVEPRAMLPVSESTTVVEASVPAPPEPDEPEPVPTITDEDAESLAAFVAAVPDAKLGAALASVGVPILDGIPDAIRALTPVQAAELRARAEAYYERAGVAA